MNRLCKCLIILLTLLLTLSACQVSTTTSMPAGQTTTGLSAASTTVSTTSVNPFGKFDKTVTIHIGKVDSFSFYGQHNDYTSSEKNVWIDSMKDKLNVEFVFDWIVKDGASNTVKWNTAIASGKIPDMGVIDRATYESLIEAGMMADTKKAYDTYASPLLKSLVTPSYELPYMSRDGKLYGLPMTNSYPQNFDVLVVRQDWLTKVGKKVPKTIDELVDVATAFKNAKLGGDKTYGLAVGNTRWGSLSGFFQGYGIPYGVWAQDAGGKTYYGNTDTRMKEAILKLQSMYKSGLLRQDYLVANTVESVTAGEAGMLYSICSGPVNAVDLYQKDPNVDMIGAEIPTVDGKLATYYDSAVPNSFVFVNKNFTNQEAAVKVVNLIAQNLSDMNYDWGYIRGACPIGSVMYEKPFSFCEYAREIEYAYTTKDTSKFTTANAKTYYNRLIKFEAGDRTLGKYHPIYRVNNGTYAILNDAYESKRIVNTIYNAVDTETMLEKKAILDKLLNTAMHKVIMGENIAVWEQALSEWSATGGQKMTDEVNAWYKANKK